jgi:3-oxoacyl-[acyl-carrier protein] reductase
MADSSRNGRVAVITGAAGALGQALVSEFAKQGWHVCAGIHRKNSPGDQLDVLTLPLDVTYREQVETAFEQVLGKWGRIDVLVNNAGIVRDAALWEMTEEDFQEVLNVNLRGAYLCSQLALRPMLKQRDGHIVNISSFSGRCGSRGQANYATAKAGLFGLTTSLAREVGSRNIRVNAVLPGVLESGITAGLKPEQMEAYARANALNRINSAEEVARFVAFLVTMQNASGQIFQLDSRIAPWT